MAKVLYGDNIADMRGKTGGSVYSRNRYGAIRRMKTSPNNPQTVHQMNQRQQFGSTASSWRSLTEDQRNAWNAAAQDFPIINIFGQSKILTGLALFIQLNQNIFNAGGTPITDPPAPVALPALNIDSFTAQEGGDYAITFNLTGTTTDTALLVYATPPVSAGRSSVKGKFRFIGEKSTGTSPAEIQGDYEDRFGALVEGQKVFISVRVVNEVTGQAGVPITTHAIVSAPAP